MSDSPLVLLEVGIHKDTSRASVVGELSRDEFSRPYKFADAYLGIAEMRLENAASHIYLAYDPYLTRSSGSSARFVVVAGAQPKLAETLGIAAGRKFDAHDLIVIFGPEMADMSDNLEAMTSIVFGDFSLFFDIAYPVACSGPISTMMPVLTQIAARIILPGRPATGVRVGGTGNRSVVDVISDRSEKVISAAMHERAAKEFGGADEDGMMGLFTTAYPLIFDLADLVAKEAKVQLGRLSDEPMPFEFMILTVHNTIAQTMRDMGMTVSDQAPTSRLVKPA